MPSIHGLRTNYLRVRGHNSKFNTFFFHSLPYLGGHDMQITINLNGLPVPADIIVYSLPEWEGLEKKDTKFGRMLKNEAVWTFSKQA